MAAHTLNELVYTFQELYRPNSVITDSIDNRLWAKFIQSTRAELIKQRLAEGIRLPDNHWIQSLGEVELDNVSADSLNGKFILRSIRPIPRTIYTKEESQGLVFVGPAVEGERGFTITSRGKALASGHGKFNKGLISTYIGTDGHLFLTSRTQLHKQIEKVFVEGIFSNPIEAYEFRHGEGSYSWNMEYPISEPIVNDMKRMIVKDNFQLVMVPIDDKHPNSIDNIANPPPQQGEVENPMRRSI